MDINHLADLDNVEYGSEKYGNENQNPVKNRRKGGNTKPNTYGFRAENALLNTNTSEDATIIAHYKQKSSRYESHFETVTMMRFLQ